MITRHLPIIALLFAVSSIQARSFAGYGSAKLTGLKRSIAVTPAAAYYGSHSRIHFYLNIADLAYAKIQTKDTSGNNASGGGFKYGAGIGLIIELGNEQSAYRNNMLSLGISYGIKAPKLKYKDATGNEQKKKLQLSVVSVPVSYTRILYFNGDAGATLQLGANIGAVTSARFDNITVTKDYSNIFIEPTVSVGFTSLFRLVNRSNGSDMGGGRAFFSPYFGYIATNMSTIPGTTSNGFDIGVRWVYSGW